MYMERTGTRAPGAKDRRGPVSKTIVEREIPPADAAAVLVRRAQAGDVHAFGELFRRYRTRIFALALQLCGSVSDADDVSQDAFLRAFRRIGDFEGRSEFFTWVYRIAINLSLNLRRDRKRRAGADLDDPRVEAAIAVDAGGDPR